MSPASATPSSACFDFPRMGTEAAGAMILSVIRPTEEREPSPV